MKEFKSGTQFMLVLHVLGKGENIDRNILYVQNTHDVFWRSKRICKTRERNSRLLFSRFA